MGIFIFISSLILIFLIAFFAARQWFEKTDTYYISYQDVSVGGLEVGSPVKYLGISIGLISNISIDPQDINSIIVKLSVDTGTPIKQDAQADIVTLGITGLKAIEIRGGTNQAEFLETGDFIKAGTSTTEEITGKANIIAEKAEKVINNLQLFTTPDNMGKFTSAADNINILARQFNSTTQLLDSMIRENRTMISETVVTTHRIAGNLDSTTRSFDEAISGINEMIQGDTIQLILGNAYDISRKLSESELKTLIQNLADMTEQTKVLLYKIDQELDMNIQEFNSSVQLLRSTLSNLEETSNKINSDPSILVRGYEDKNIPDRRLKK